MKAIKIPDFLRWQRHLMISFYSYEIVLWAGTRFDILTVETFYAVIGAVDKYISSPTIVMFDDSISGIT